MLILKCLYRITKRNLFPVILTVAVLATVITVSSIAAMDDNETKENAAASSETTTAETTTAELTTVETTTAETTTKVETTTAETTTKVETTTAETTTKVETTTAETTTKVETTTAEPTTVETTTAESTTEEIEAIVIDSDDLEVLAHLINGEAGDQNDECQRAVGTVVMNRLARSDFPDTIREVVFDDGQYACTWDGNYYKEPTQQAYNNARWILEGNRNLDSNYIYQAGFPQGYDRVWIGSECFGRG